MQRETSLENFRALELLILQQRVELLAGLDRSVVPGRMGWAEHLSQSVVIPQWESVVRCILTVD